MGDSSTVALTKVLHRPSRRSWQRLALPGSLASPEILRNCFVVSLISEQVEEGEVLETIYESATARRSGLVSGSIHTPRHHC